MRKSLKYFISIGLLSAAAFFVPENVQASASEDISGDFVEEIDGFIYKKRQEILRQMEALKERIKIMEQTGQTAGPEFEIQMQDILINKQELNELEDLATQLKALRSQLTPEALKKLEEERKQKEAKL